MGGRIPPVGAPPQLTCLVLLATAGDSSVFSLSLCLLTPRLPSPLCRLQLRKDESSGSAAQTGGSPAASTPADAPHRPESAKGEGTGPGGKVSMEVEEEAEEAPKGATLAQENTAKQDGVCG